MYDCMEDCIHLKACRRVQAIGRKHRLMVPRYCTKDCSAYVSGDIDVVTVEEAISYARSGAESILNGCGPRDVYCSVDLEEQTLGTLIESLMEDDYEEIQNS